MSKVSGVTLIIGSGGKEEEPVDRVHDWLLKKDPRDQLREVTDYAGGIKHPQCEIYCGGFNFFDENQFAEFVMSLPWRDPENVVLVIQPEEGPTRVWRPAILEGPIYAL